MSWSALHQRNQNVEEIAIAVIRRGVEVLVTRRQSDPLAGYDEFPGGHREPGESLEACLTREVLEEVGYRVAPQRLLALKRHEQERRKLWLWFFECRLVLPQPAARGSASEPRWVPIAKLPGLRLLPANERVVELLVKELARAAP